jgi:hypothetical protein
MAKYKVKNKQIELLRQEKRQLVIGEIKGYQKDMKEVLNNSINRNKFLNKFYLYMGFAKKTSAETRKKGLDSSKCETFERLTCDHKWPVCLFDFTYKNKIPDYFIY